MLHSEVSGFESNHLTKHSSCTNLVSPKNMYFKLFVFQSYVYVIKIKSIYFKVIKIYVLKCQVVIHYFLVKLYKYYRYNEF